MDVQIIRLSVSDTLDSMELGGPNGTLQSPNDSTTSVNFGDNIATAIDKEDANVEEADSIAQDKTQVEVEIVIGK